MAGCIAQLPTGSRTDKSTSHLSECHTSFPRPCHCTSADGEHNRISPNGERRVTPCERLAASDFD